MPPPAGLIIRLQTVLQMPCTCSWAPSRPAGAAQPLAKLLRRERQRPDLQGKYFRPVEEGLRFLKIGVGLPIGADLRLLWESFDSWRQGLDS